MTSTSARVAHMRNWVEQLEQEIARLQVERDTLWKAIVVLDPDGKVPFGSLTSPPPAKVTTTKAAPKRPPGRPRGRPPKVRAAGQADATVTQIGSAKSARAATRDYVEIAQHIIEFRNSGTPVTPALVKFYKVPESTAKNWMSRCRELGLLPPVVANLKVIEDHTTGDHSTAVYNATEVANTYLEAHRENLRPLQFVADSLGIDKATATSWVRQARLDGALPSAAEPQLPEAERRKILAMSKPEPVA